MEATPRQSHECEFSSMCETTFGKEIKPSTMTKVRNLYSGMVLKLRFLKTRLKEKTEAVFYMRCHRTCLKPHFLELYPRFFGWSYGCV